MDIRDIQLIVLTAATLGPDYETIEYDGGQRHDWVIVWPGGYSLRLGGFVGTRWDFPPDGEHTERLNELLAEREDDESEQEPEAA